MREAYCTANLMKDKQGEETTYTIWHWKLCFYLDSYKQQYCNIDDDIVGEGKRNEVIVSALYLL